MASDSGDRVAPSRTRGSYPKGQARRQQIVDEAVLVFGRSGSASGSLREVAKRVGLTPAGLLHHFASKEELFAEVLRQRDERVRAAAGEPAEHGLIAQAGKVVAYNQTTRGLTSLYSTVVAEAADPDHPLHDDFAARYRARAEATAALLRAGQRAGEIAPDIDPEAGARLISAVMDGIQQQWLLDATVDMTALFDEFVRGYLRAPRAAASPR
ncbi:TetR family transcriptional regulator [Microbacterium sp. AG790]|uniref:TetR/AcrR family transcriptional regulator n=1 Tax=Microbacterium sp. AG790 TaxID=2183995 RepID=UPI000EADDCFD|nr:TetR/AcrR family transcriptional regulator [Microbacterium sp. AG790]RKS93219.1 TetR family transcriptional regulator [Microbacterium sp. AG790]